MIFRCSPDRANSDETFAYAASQGLGAIGTPLSQPMPRLVDRLREFKAATPIKGSAHPQPFHLNISFFVAESREKADAAIDEVASHDLTMKKIQRRMDERERRWDGEGLTYEERLQRIVAEEADPPANNMFPVDAQWALEWDEVEEDTETPPASSVRTSKSGCHVAVEDSTIHHPARPCLCGQYDQCRRSLSGYCSLKLT